MRSSWRFSALFGVLALFSGAVHAKDAVSVQLDWVVRGNHAPFFVAKEKGYFADQGIDVTAIRKGTGSTDALRLVANGNADFGFSDLPTLMVGRSQGVANSALLAVNQKTPLAIISLKKNFDLRNAKQLKDANIGVHPSGSTYIFLKAALAKNGLALADIKQSTVSPPYENLLLLNRVNVVPGYIDAEVPELEHKAGGPGSLSILHGEDLGIRSYGSGVFTSDKNIAQRPDLVQRFVTAYAKAFADVIQDPEAAADTLIKNNPEYKGKKEMLVAQLRADLDFTFFSEHTRTHGIGWIDPALWRSSAMLFKEQGALSPSFDDTQGFDTRFLEKAQALKQ
ncbi:ABC transporter substrate-binding protein [Achromobacter xylosoxidans]|uniref:ABC transporter substrate-binding protein n=1 Tax=Alcaligenes xylosoxydans xylosoxydans TaxID=85698 RepID=UPI000B494791|nr:ABC transporter substrate-binding protein [Achromobacter xylosoxidans]